MNKRDQIYLMPEETGISPQALTRDPDIDGSISRIKRIQCKSWRLRSQYVDTRCLEHQKIQQAGESLVHARNVASVKSNAVV